MDVDCGVQYTLLEECSKSMKEHSTFIKEHSKTQVHACAFCVFRAIWILNGYNLSGQMKAHYECSDYCSQLSEM